MARGFKKNKSTKNALESLRRTAPCPFCESKTAPDYKEHKILVDFVTDRGKIVSGIKTGVCSKHQRRLSREVKRARHLGLLPFISQV